MMQLALPGLPSLTVLADGAAAGPGPHEVGWHTGLGVPDASLCEQLLAGLSAESLEILVRDGLNSLVVMHAPAPFMNDYPSLALGGVSLARDADGALCARGGYFDVEITDRFLPGVGYVFLASTRQARP